MSNPVIHSEGSLRIEEDEIDLNELFSKIWRRRKFIGALVFISVVIVAGISSVQYMLKPSVKNYSVSVRFNFPTSIKGEYPSGQSFSKNDLIASVVLKQVFDHNHLKEQGLKFEDFASSFSVSPYAINSEFIKKKYEGILANKKLSRTELEELDKQYANELETAQANFAKLSYVDSTHLGLSPLLIEKILNDVARVWSEISIKDLGVLDLKIPGKQFYQPALVEKYEYLQAVQYMLDSSKRFKEILEKLEQDDIGGFVRDSKTDLVVPDLLARLESIYKFDLNPIYSVISNLGLVKNRQKAELYLKNQIELTTDRLAELKQKSQVYREAMRSYSTQGENGSSSGQKSAANLSSGMVQYGDGFLSKIIGMVEEQKDTEYRQSLLSKQIDFGIELQESSTELGKLQRAIKILKTKGANNNSLTKNYAKQIKDINKNLVLLVDTFQRILEARNRHVLGKTSSLYELAADKMFKTSDLKARLKKVLIITIVSAVLTLMLAVFIALVVKEKDLEPKTVINS